MGGLALKDLQKFNMHGSPREVEGGCNVKRITYGVGY